MTDTDAFAERKSRASDWFRALRDEKLRSSYSR